MDLLLNVQCEAHIKIRSSVHIVNNVRYYKQRKRNNVLNGNVVVIVQSKSKTFSSIKYI